VIITIVPGPPPQNRTANAGRRWRHARASGKGSEKISLRSHDADSLVGDFDALGAVLGAGIIGSGLSLIGLFLSLHRAKGASSNA
jgi:hypothetical protein